jgi:hypothetical protein
MAKRRVALPGGSIDIGGSETQPTFEEYAKQAWRLQHPEGTLDPLNVGSFEAYMRGGWEDIWRKQYGQLFGGKPSPGSPESLLGSTPDLTDRLIREARTAQLLRLQLGRGRRSTGLGAPLGTLPYGTSPLFGG